MSYTSMFALIGLLSALFICSTLADTVVPTSACFASRSTWFADNQHGACMYGPSLGPTGNGNYLIAASSMLVFNNSADCGACYQITGASGASVIVTVVDQCTDGGVCNTAFPHLDLSPQAFNTIADPTVAGVTSTNVMRVACPVTGGVKLAVGSNFFMASNFELLIFNTRLPITAVTLSFGGKTTSLVRQTYNYWLYNGPAVSWPAVIAVTDVKGDVVSFQPLTLSTGMIVEAAAQFPVPAAYPGTPQKCAAPSTMAADGWIYQDSLSQQYTSIDYINVFQWLDYSYSGSVNWAYTTAPYAGTNCVKAVLSGYGGVQLGQSYSFPWANTFTSLQFAVKGDAAVNSIVFSLKGYKTVPIPITTSWQLVTLSLASDLQAPATIGGQVTLLWANTLGATAPAIYLDSIKFVPAGSSTTPTTPVTPATSAPVVPAATTQPATKAPTNAPPAATAAPTNAPASAATAAPTNAPAAPTNPPAAPATAAPPAAASGCAGLFVNQTIVSSWRDSAVHNIYTLTITNSNPTAASNIKVSVVPAAGIAIEQMWNLNLVSGNIYTIPYVLESKQIYTGSGYITGAAAATVTIVC